MIELRQCSNTTFEGKMQFSHFPILPGSAEAQVIWCGTVKRLLTAYFIGNISAKSYQNLSICVKVIASQRWDVADNFSGIIACKSSSPIYTIQPVVKPVVKPVWQSVKCLYTRYNQLSIWLSNPFDNWLYRVYSRLSNQLYNTVWQPCWTNSLFIQHGCQTGLTTGCIV